MALDRWIALVFLLICLVYGYAAFFTMDAGMPPFMKRNPVWPSTFPKVLSVMGTLAALYVLLGFEKPSEQRAGDIDYRRLWDYNLGQALLLLGLMFLYAVMLRPAGFILSTSVFLIAGSLILGERRIVTTIVVALIATGAVWYLVEGVLGIFLRPLPFFMGT
jgi:putative tricarboxylic transport membrane protein